MAIQQTRFKPYDKSGDYMAMEEFWRLVADILGGAQSIRAAGERYLPRRETETDADYKSRTAVAPWTPLYDQSVRNIVSKPFEKELTLIDGTFSPRVEALVENIDGRGNHLFVFARDVFRNAVDFGVDWIFVDFPRAYQGMTLADERASGARPVWHRVPARRMLAVYEAETAEGTILTHIRIDESSVELVDRLEKLVSRVRVIERLVVDDGLDEAGNRVRPVRYGNPQWELWESRSEGAWAIVDEGEMTIDVIPAVPMLTGERLDGSWRLRPPLRDLAYMQITEYQMAANRQRVQDMTGFPMWAVIGMSKPDEPIPVGPGRMLFVPPVDGTQLAVQSLEPSGSAGAMLREDLELHRAEMREAGLQPLLPKSGNVTATANALAQAKAHSAVQMWALALKDALEQAFVLTAMWLGEDSSPEVSVFTDFDVETNSVDGLRVVVEMYDKGLVSREATIMEAKRRKILSPEYDEDEDLALIEAVEDEGQDGPASAFLSVPFAQPGEPAQQQSETDDEA